MDGREFVNMPPLGLPLEPGRVSSGAAGGRLIPSTGQLPPFCTAKYFPTPLGLHSQPGFPHLGRTVYHSYIPISHLESSTGGTPLLTHMGPRNLIEPPKDGFCFSAPLSTYHPRPSLGKTSTNQIQNSRLNENDAMCHSFKNSRDASKDSKEKFCRNELFNSQLMGTSKKDGRLSEETFSGEMVDHDSETKMEKERKRSGLPRVPKIGDHVSSFISEQALINSSGSSEKPTHTLHTSPLSSYNHGSDSFVKSLGSEVDRCVKDASRLDENLKTLLPEGLNRAKRRDSAVTPATTLNVLCSCSSLHPSNLCKIGSSSPVLAQPLPNSMYNRGQSKDSDKMKTTVTPTCELHFEVLKEQNDSRQVGNQIHNFKAKEVGKLDEKAEVLYSNFLQEVSNNELKRVEVFREKGSVICCNSSIKSQGVSDLLIDTPTVNSLEKRISISAKDTGTTYCQQGDHSKEKCKVSGFLDSHQHTGHPLANPPEQKVKHLEITDFRASQIDGLSAQHFTTHGKEEAKKICVEPKPLGSNKPPADFTYPFTHSDGCAMQSLIKYSGNFEKEAAIWKSSDKKSPFGGLGSMRLDESQVKAAKGQSVSHQDVKRDPDRPGSTKLFIKDTVGFQGEVEVRNPPVGIAVAVARQKDTSGNKSVSSKGHTNEETGDEQIRNCNERVLIERMDRERAELLRENKDLPDLSPMHPAGCAAIGLSSNLMVTGGPALSGPWTSDSTSHLTTHPWLSSGVLPCMWHPDNPYGLAHPTLHQAMNPAVPPGMPASFPSAYSFARDPQNGQIVVIPAEHLSNFAEILDRTSSLWPSMYSSAHSSLQHAHQLQLFSQQQLMRQHELYMLLQQQAVHSIDLHRSAQLEALESQRSEQLDTMDLQRNSQLDILDMQRSAQMELKELHRRNHLESQQYHRSEHCREPTKVGEERAVENTSEARHPSPLCSSGPLQKKVISQASSTDCGKAFDLSPIHLKLFPLSNKTEEITPQDHDLHTSKNPDLCPAVSASILPNKVENNEEMTKGMNIKPDSSLNEDTTQGFPFQSLSSSVRQHLSCINQLHEVSDEECFIPIVKQPELSTESPELNLNSKSHNTKNFDTSEKMDNIVKVEDVSETCRESLQDESGSCSVPVECQKGLVQEMKFMAMEENDRKSVVENITFCTSGAIPRTGKETCSTQTDFPDTLTLDENCQMNRIVVPQGILPPNSANEMMDNSVEIGKECTEGDTDGMFSCLAENMSGGHSDTNCTNVKTEDPLAGMNVLVAATEMPEASSLLPLGTVILTPDLTLDHTLLDGIILLSEMAELELKKRKPVDNMQSYHARPSLESLLAASTQMLMEVLSSSALDGLRPESIKLPRELSHNKKYSWKQEKNPHFSLTSAIEIMDSVEVDCRVRLAELQRQYKEKQRELAKLQRKRDSEDKTDERSKTMSKRGPGRPKKRKHGINPLFYKDERMKNSSNRRLEKRVLLSESSKTGSFFQRSLLNVSEIDEIKNGTGDLKDRLHSPEENERVQGYMYEAQSIFKKKRKSSIQNHLFSTLDTALSLRKPNKEKSCFKFTDHNGRKPRDVRNLKNISSSDFKQMCSFQLSRTNSKEDTDTDEDENILRNEWSSQSRPQPYSMYSMLSRKMKSFERSPSSERISSFYRTGKHKSVSRNKQFHLLLMDREAGFSFSDSTEDSFDQGY